MGLVTYFYIRGYNSVTKYHGHPSTPHLYLLVAHLILPQKKTVESGFQDHQVSSSWISSGKACVQGVQVGPIQSWNV